jgi:predicted metalloprotease with PDZ domain
VADVRVGGPADTVGIQAGDELLALNGVTLMTPDDLFKEASRLKTGRAATLRILRDGTARDLKIIVDEGAPARDGVRVAARTPPTTVVDAEDKPDVDTKVTPEVNLGATLGTATDGVAVVRLEKNSPLARAGLKDGDRIRQVAGRNVLTPDSLFRVLNEFDGGSKVEIVVLRDGEELDFALILPEDHERVLVEGVEPTPTVDENDSVRRTPNETHLVQRVRELEQANLLQQRQIQFLYNALVDTRNQLGYPALSTAVPFLGFPAAGDGTGTGENDGTGVDGTGVDGTDAGTGQQPRTRQRRSIEIESPPDPPDVPRRR